MKTNCTILGTQINKACIQYDKVNRPMTSKIITYTSQHAWFQYCTNLKIYIGTGENYHKIILHLMSIKTIQFQMKSF